MFIRENPIVENKALTRPIISNDSSVNVAMATPRIMGTNDQ